MDNRYLDPRRIEFLVTFLCNGSCRHCYAPKQEAGYPKHIDESFAVEIVGKVGSEYDVESVMTFGGEPMLFPGIVCSIHGEAAGLGIPRREVITNGFWSRSVGETSEIAKELAEAGVNSLHFSVDAFHQEHIPLGAVREAVESCLEAGIEDVALNPCWLVSEDDGNEFNRETRSVLEELGALPVRISSGNIVEPDGLALLNLREYMPPRVRAPTGRCGDMPYTEPLESVRSISVEPDGKVAVCNDLYIGDASETDIVRIVEGYDPFEIPAAKALIAGGVDGLVEWARAEGVDPDPEGYYTICHMCTDIRKRVNARTRL
jgi:hypothetical protein